MNRIVSIALIAGGAALVAFGVAAVDSFSSDFSRFFTGAPTDKAIWMLLGGIVVVIVGLSGLSFGSHRSAS